METSKKKEALASEVMEFITKNQSTGKKAIEAGTGHTSEEVTEAIEHLMESGKITKVTAGKKTTYSVAVSNGTAEQTAATTEEQPVAETKPVKAEKKKKLTKSSSKPAQAEKSKKTAKDSSKSKARTKGKSTKATPAAVKEAAGKKKPGVRTADNFNRNFSKMRFDGKDMPKGRAVHAVILKYVEKHKNVTLAKLKEAFPDELLPNWGVIKELSVAKKASASGKKRYFINNEDVITLVGGQKVAIGNQWSSKNLPDFVKHAKKLGFMVTSAKAK